MSEIFLKSIRIKNYRSFGNEEQTFTFPDEEYKKPVAIIGYNNAGKTNFINAIKYSLFESIREETFELKDFHNCNWNTPPEFSCNFYADIDDSKLKGCDAENTVSLVIESNQRIKSVSDSCSINSGYSKKWAIKQNAPIFYINFHKIKEEISTTKTSWGNLRSFLAKHIRKLVDNDQIMKSKQDKFMKDLKLASNEVMNQSELSKFIKCIENNYSTNLRNNKCQIDFNLPDYEDIFLNMIFKVGLNKNIESLIPIDHFGDGYISMFVMAVIQAIAENSQADKCLFLFEEPESFLHENHQEYFYKMVLCELAEKGHQVIYTTHSDKMVDIFDTQSFIRLEFDETKKQTIRKYNDPRNNPIREEQESGTNLSEYNSIIKNIEPNLNKILFSRKVVLVEGPNDLLVYKYIIQKKLEDKGKDTKYGETYLSFKNFTIIPHHGKSTAYLLAQLCKHVEVDYFLINDWDFKTDFRDDLDQIEDFEGLKASNHWEQIKKENNKNGEPKKEQTLQSIFTTNKNLKKHSLNNQIHFNSPRLEEVLGYASNDKDPFKIWKMLKKNTNFDTNIFPEALEKFLEIDRE